MRPPPPDSDRADRLLAAVLLLLLVMGLLQLLVAESWWVAQVLCYLPPAPWVASLALVVLAAGRRASPTGRRAAALALMVLAAGFLDAQLPRPRSVPRGVDLRVVTYNVLHATHGFGPLLELIHRTRPDVLCLQEATPLDDHIRDVSAILAELPGWTLYQLGELAILSPHPLRHTRAHWPTTPDARPIISAELELQGQPVTIFCTHLLNGLGPQYLRHGWRDLPRLIAWSAPVRAEQLATLLRVAGQTAGPVVLAGDFNAPPRGKLYARLRARYRDAFAEAGWGGGYTFRADAPVVRIDFVWCGPGVGVKRCRPLRHAGSDHRPLLADLVISKAAPGLASDDRGG